MQDDDIDTEAEIEVEEETEQGLEAEGNAEWDTEEEIPASKSAKFGRGFILGGFALSILLGGTLGVIGSKVFSGPDRTIALRAELQQGLEDIRQTAQAQTKQLGSAANTVKNNTKGWLDTLQAENLTLVNKVDTLEQTISLLQLATKTYTKTFSDRIAVLEALSGENADVFVGAGSIAARLDDLEEKLLAANLAQEQDAADAAQEKLPEDALDVKRISVKPPIDITRQASLDVLINTFPRAKLLSAVKAQQQAASKKTGWLKRALSKHVRVGNDNAPDPYDIIEAAEAALLNGQITVALKRLEQLNPPVRSSAADWVEAARKAAPHIEKTQ